jgi:hypothetical protein
MSKIIGMLILGYLVWLLYDDKLKVFAIQTLANNLSLPEKYLKEAIITFPHGTTRAKFRTFVRTT